MTTPDHFAKSSWMLTLASIAVVVAALYLAKGLLIPLTLAVLLSFLLIPVCDWLELRKLGRIPSVLITALLAFTILGGLTWTAVAQVISMAPQMPVYERNFQAKLESVNDSLSTALSNVTRAALNVGRQRSQAERAEEPKELEERPYPVRLVASAESPLQVIAGKFGSLLEVLGSGGIVVILVIFFLIRREDLRDRFIRLVGRGEVTVTTQTLEDAANRVSRYLLVQLIINATFGVPIGIGLYFIGVPNAILWGILAATLRFVPYIGVFIAAAGPIALSMAISTGWRAPILTAGLFAVLELFINYVMEPWLYGKNTGVSPVAVLVAAIFWTWIWGAVGLLVATPLTVCLLVIGKHVPQLSFLQILLGNEPVFEPETRVYQRLLAGDQEEAAELIEAQLEQMPLLEVYDTVLIPALAMCEIHWHRDELDESRHKFILDALKASTEELGERHQALQESKAAAERNVATTEPVPTPVANPPEVSIVCLPAHHEADEIAGMMLAQLLQTRHCRVHAAIVTGMVSEMVELVEQHKADVVCISATPPAAVLHARYLCKRLRDRFPEVKLVIGLWNAKGDLTKSRERIGCGPTAQVVASMADARVQIRLLAQSISQRVGTAVEPVRDRPDVTSGAERSRPVPNRRTAETPAGAIKHEIESFSTV